VNQGLSRDSLSGADEKAAWHSKPSWFVIASNDRAIAPEQEISTARRMGSEALTLCSSHLPMLSHPDEVADFVIGAAASLRSQRRSVGFFQMSAGPGLAKSARPGAPGSEQAIRK
jgi:hypothetical protein